MRAVILVLGLLIGCMGTAPAEPSAEVPVETVVPASPETPTPMPDPTPAVIDPDPTPDAPVPAAEVTPASLYAECRDRVEQPEAAGECKSAADCTSTGCGNEICTSATAAADIMSTCEERRCFKVLEACGCVDGKCTWSLKAAVPEGRPMRLP